MPTVEGLALGETLNATKKKLGKPLRQNYSTPNVCNNESLDSLAAMRGFDHFDRRKQDA